jgi:hypothetical protein
MEWNRCKWTWNERYRNIWTGRLLKLGVLYSLNEYSELAQVRKYPSAVSKEEWVRPPLNRTSNMVILSVRVSVHL